MTVHLQAQSRHKRLSVLRPERDCAGARRRRGRRHDDHRCRPGKGPEQDVTPSDCGYEEMDFTGPHGQLCRPDALRQRLLEDRRHHEPGVHRAASAVSVLLPEQQFLSESGSLREPDAPDRATTYWMLGWLENNHYSDRWTPPRLRGLLRGRRQWRADLPSDGTRRRDRAWSVQAGLGFQVSRSARAFLGYNYQARSSNMLQSFPEVFLTPSITL